MRGLTKPQRRFIADCIRFNGGVPPEVLVAGEVGMARRLEEVGFVELLNAHPVSGRMHQAYYATPAGREALQDQGTKP